MEKIYTVRACDHTTSWSSWRICCAYMVYETPWLTWWRAASPTGEHAHRGLLPVVRGVLGVPTVPTQQKVILSEDEVTWVGSIKPTQWVPRFYVKSERPRNKDKCLGQGHYQIHTGGTRARDLVIESQAPNHWATGRILITKSKKKFNWQGHILLWNKQENLSRLECLQELLVLFKNWHL